MNRKLARRIVPRVISFLAVGLLLAGPLCIPEAEGNMPAVYTPAPGTAERRAILDAMRLEVKALHQLDVVFVVVSMKACNGWAFAHTRPRSGDGSSRYEDFLALLHRVKGTWWVVEIPCTEEDNPDCIGSPGYLTKLVARFPGLPPGILPGNGRKP
jgi:hypothetical protein